MRRSPAVNCVIKTVKKIVKNRSLEKQKRQEQFQQIIQQFPPPSHYNGVKDLDLSWIAGWYQGDGCIKAHLYKSQKTSLGASVGVQFQSTQSIKSCYIIQDLADYVPLVGDCTSKIYVNTPGYVMSLLSSHKQLYRAFHKLNGMFIGDKWFDYIVCKHITNLLMIGYGREIQYQIFLARYIVHHFKNNGKNSDENSKMILKTMESRAMELGHFCPETDFKELINYKCYQPRHSLDERFVLGFIEAEGCFHVHLQVKTQRFPLVIPKLAFLIVQSGKKNKFILEDILLKMGGVGSLTERKYLKNYGNMPISSKYYDFAKFTEICWGMSVGKHKSQLWIQHVIHLAHTMNKSPHQNLQNRQFSVQQYLFYMSLASNTEDVKTKKRNLPVFKQLVFKWVKSWKHFDSGTKKQKEIAQFWLKNLATKDLKLYLNDYYESKRDVLKVLDFVASTVSGLSQDEVDFQWLQQYSQNDDENSKIKSRPFFLIMEQLDLSTIQTH